MSTKSNRKTYIDLLNILSCFSVLILHSTDNVFQFANTGVWWVSITFQAFAHFSIPVFFMLCGATLLNYRKRQTTLEYFKRRFLRVFVPFVIWSFIYFIGKYAIGQLNFTGIRSFANLFLNNGILNIFWFFYSIIAIYLFIPILSIITDHASKKLLIYLCGLCFLGTTIIKAINIYTGFSITSYFNIPMGSGNIGYVLLGYILSTYEIKKPYRLLLYTFGICSVLTMIFGTYYLSLKNNALNPQILDYLSISCVLCGASVFVFIKNLPFDKLKGTKIQKFLSTLSSASFGVYMMQMIPIMFISWAFPGLTLAWHYVLWAPILIYIFTVCVALIIKKIPIIKNILP